MIKYIKDNAFTILVLVATLGYLGYARLPGMLSGMAIEGHPATDFAIDGDGVPAATLAELRGKKVLLVFWGTWCGFCRQEVPALIEAYDATSRESFEILAVTDEPRSKVQPFMQSEGINYPVVYDHEGLITGAYPVQGYPTTVWIDEAGVVEKVSTGATLGLAYRVKRWANGSVL